MNNFIQEGLALDLAAPAGGVVSGKPVKIGAILAVPSVTAAEGVLFAGWTEGVYQVDTNTGTAWAVGDVIYWDDTNKRFTKAATDNTKAGIAVEDKASAAVTAKVKLVPTI